MTLDWLEEHKLKKIPIRVEYVQIDRQTMGVERYHARTGEKLGEDFLLQLVPYENPHEKKNYS